MIKISQLEVTRDGRAICVVEKLVVTPGMRLVVTGSNGSGKTTLLRVLAGLEKDYRGTCRVDVGHCERTYLHQQPFLFRGTVLANVCYGLRNRAGGGATGNPEAMAWLKRLGIDHLADRTTQNLSGGEARRVALARALACRPRLLLLDQPLDDLDPSAAKTVCQVLGELPETTLVVASPNPLPAILPMSIYQLD
ncbi:MAG: ATP-binding cassette domain-containing protein [Planctomycetes bacterium]|nr:ATP-binding cassette domain-containing protein [Planctomycetota bacterium]